MLTKGFAYMEAVIALQRQIIATQGEALSQAADLMEKSVRAGGRIFLFGTGHSHMMAEEGFHRAGGLACVVPILSGAVMMHEGAIWGTAIERLRGVAKPLLLRFHPEPRDTIIVFSNSGVNAVPVEMAMTARELGLSVIGVLSLSYAKTAPVGAAGARLSDVVQVAVDNAGIPGDALIEVHPSGIKAGPSSTVTGAMIVNALLVEVAARLGAEGVPPVYISSNMPDAEEHNAALQAQFREGNPYL